MESAYTGGKKRFLILNVIIFSALTVLIILFSFFDLKISDALYNGNSFFGKFFENAGELPAYLTAPFFLVCVFYKFKNKTLRITSGILMSVSNYFWLEKIFRFFTLSTLAFWLVMTAAVILASVLFFTLFSKIPSAALDKLFYIFLAGAFFAVISNSIVQLLKIIWGRVRYIDLSENFSPWYQPHGNTGDKSFPSGHTTSACGMLVLFLFFRQFNLSKLQKTGLAILSTGFIFCTALSRIIIGAHYASDVTFSVLICYPLFLLSIRITDKIYSKFKTEPLHKPD